MGLSCAHPRPEPQPTPVTVQPAAVCKNQKTTLTGGGGWGGIWGDGRDQSAARKRGAPRASGVRSEACGPAAPSSASVPRTPRLPSRPLGAAGEA